MAAHIEGKTINELARIDEITGQEIIPLSMLNEETGAYVTRGITIDNLFKVIYGMIQEAESKISYNADAMTSYVSYLTSVDSILSRKDNELEEEIEKTNTYVSYNAEGIIKVHNELRDLGSYTTYNVGYIYDHLGDHSYIIDDLERRVAYNTYAIGQEGLRNDTQDQIISYHTEQIAYESLRNDEQDEILAYESYRNNVQDRDIRTIYIENSKDAFNDYGDPNDDNVNPDLDPDSLARLNSW